MCAENLANVFKFNPGERYIFAYPKEFTTMPHYTARAGQVVTISRELDGSEYDYDGERMFEVIAEDGLLMQAYEGELLDLPVEGT